MTTPDQTPTKGAGTLFQRLKDDQTLSTLEDFTGDEKWDTLSELKDIQPAEITVEDEEDDYLDDENSDWNRTAPGNKNAGETQLTLAWKPGDTLQQQLVKDIDNGTITYYRAKYPNGTVDVWYGYVNSLGKTVTRKEKMTRTVKIKNVGKPKTAEHILIEQAAAVVGA